jgi:hypothetical protein
VKPLVKTFLLKKKKKKNQTKLNKTPRISSNAKFCILTEITWNGWPEPLTGQNLLLQPVWV